MKTVGNRKKKKIRLFHFKRSYFSYMLFFRKCLMFRWSIPLRMQDSIFIQIMEWIEIANIHCVKSVQIRIFSGPHFPTFGLNTERYEVSLRVQSECGKYGPEKTPYLDTFHKVIVSSINGMHLLLKLALSMNKNLISGKKLFYIACFT